MKLPVKILFLLAIVFDIGQSIFGFLKYKDNLFLILAFFGFLIFLGLYSELIKKHE